MTKQMLEKKVILKSILEHTSQIRFIDAIIDGSTERLIIKSFNSNHNSAKIATYIMRNFRKDNKKYSKDTPDRIDGFYRVYDIQENFFVNIIYSKEPKWDKIKQDYDIKEFDYFCYNIEI